MDHSENNNQAPDNQTEKETSAFENGSENSTGKLPPEGSESQPQDVRAPQPSAADKEPSAVSISDEEQSEAAAEESKQNFTAAQDRQTDLTADGSRPQMAQKGSDTPSDEDSGSRSFSPVPPPFPPKEPPQSPRPDKESNSGKTRATVLIMALIPLILLVIVAIAVGASQLTGKVPNSNTSSSPSAPALLPSEERPSDSGSTSIQSKPPKEPVRYETSYDINGWVDKDDLQNEQPVVNVVTKCTPSIVTINSDTGSGSGVIWTSDGYIVTNNHVVSGSKTVRVTLVNNSSYPASVIATDEQNDLALLRVCVTGLLPAELRQEDSPIKVGETAIVIGNPLGTLANTVTKGIVSGLNRNLTIEGVKMTLMQVDAAVNPGNSGGGCFDIYGRLIGIINAKSVNEDLEGLGYAIPLETVKTVIARMISEDQTVLKKSIGITGTFINSESYEDLKKNADLATLISAYEESLKGELRGILVANDVQVDYVDITDTFCTGAGSSNNYSQYTYTYDLITAIDGVSVSDPEELNRLLESKYTAGQAITVTVQRISLVYRVQFTQLIYQGCTSAEEKNISIRVVEYYR